MKFGVSFSLHRCSELGIDKKTLLKAAISELGFRHFRLMSYWNIHEATQGFYDFHELDWQLDEIAASGGSVSLCVGKRQPRWPECHMPNWANQQRKDQWYESLYRFIETVTERYKTHPALSSWQLENEALLKSFGYCVDQDYSHKRLRTELDIIKRTDPYHPVIMTLSDSWGFPWKKPIPDMYAMSLYRITINKKGEVVHSKRPPLFYQLRGTVIEAVRNRPVFIHELQAEPWLETALLDAPTAVQLERMNPDIFEEIIAFAQSTGMKRADLWGLEWWYWLKLQGYPEMWEAAKKLTKV